MRIRQTAGAALMALGLAAVPAVAAAETLTDTLISAYKNSNLLDQQRAVLRAADEDVAQAVAALRPVLNFVASADYTTGLFDSGMGPAVRTEESTSSLGLTAQMVIYAGGQNRLLARAAQQQVLATRAALVGVEQQVLFDAVQAYLDVRRGQQVVSVRRNNIDVLQEQLDAEQDRFDVGESTRTDVSLARSRLAAARSQLAAARGDLERARESFKIAVGRAPGDLRPIGDAPATPDNEAAAKKVAVRTHPDITQAQRQVKAADLNVAVARAAMRPRLTGTARAAVDEDGNDQSSIGLDLTQPIYKGGGLSSQVRQARAQRSQARSTLLQTVLRAKQQVGNAWANLGAANAQLSSSDDQIRAARIAFNGLQEEQRLGARTVLDVLDAEQDLRDAQLDQVSAVSNRYSAIYMLLASMGLLTAEHLDLGIRTYDPEAYYNAVKNAPVRSIRGGRLDKVLKSLGKK